MYNTTTSHGLWSITAPSQPDFPTLQEDVKVDVAVVGGGYTGLSAALHLAEAGTQVGLVEAKDIGYGGSGRNVGLVNAGLWLMPDEVVQIMGKEYGERILQELGTSPELVFELINKHGIECEAVRRGTLHCAHSSSGYEALKQREAQWSQRGAPVFLLDREKAAPMIGSKAFYGALLDKRAGRVQPLAYAYGLSRAAQVAGAKIFIDSPVTSYKHDGGYWKLNTPHGCLQAKKVIVAVQGYPLEGFSEQSRSMIPFNFFQFSTPPLPERIRKTILPDGQPAWDTNLVLSSYRLDNDGRLIIGSVGQARNGAYGLHKKWTLRTIRRVFPQIGPVELEYAWDGVIRMTTDNVPKFYDLGKGMVTVTSYNGRGIGPGTKFGKLLAEYIQTEDPQKIPIPMTKHGDLATRGLRGMYFEVGARLYHFIQRRV